MISGPPWEQRPHALTTTDSWENHNSHLGNDRNGNKRGRFFCGGGGQKGGLACSHFVEVRSGYRALNDSLRAVSIVGPVSGTE